MATAITVVWASFGGSDAQAIPAFTRKYDMDCSHCHVMAPKLNRVGNTFHDNFTLKNALGDLAPEVRDRVRSEDPEDTHPAYWPVSFRIAGGYQYDKRDQQLTSSGVLQPIATRSFALSRLELLAGGLITPGISYYVSYYPAVVNVGLPGQPPIHAHAGATAGQGQTGALGFAWVRFADLFGQVSDHHDHAEGDERGHDGEAEPKHRHGQDLIVGSHELHLTLSGHHRLTNTPYLAYRYDPRVSDTSDQGFRLDSPQIGASLDGATPWFGYALSVYNGTSSSADNNRALDVFATVTEEIGEQRFGVFGVRGTVPTSSVTAPGPVVFPGTGMGSRPFFRAGADADLNFGRLNLMLFYLYGEVDKDLFSPATAAQTAKFHGAFIESDYMIESARTMLIARYDVIRNLAQGLATNPKPQRDTDALTVALRRDLVLTSRMNLQLHLEANTTRTKAAPITTIINADQTSNTAYVGLDLAF